MENSHVLQLMLFFTTLLLSENVFRTGLQAKSHTWDTPGCVTWAKWRRQRPQKMCHESAMCTRGSVEVSCQHLFGTAPSFQHYLETIKVRDKSSLLPSAWQSSPRRRPTHKLVPQRLKRRGHSQTFERCRSWPGSCHPDATTVDHRSSARPSIPIPNGSPYVLQRSHNLNLATGVPEHDVLATIANVDISLADLRIAGKSGLRLSVRTDSPQSW